MKVLRKIKQISVYGLAFIVLEGFAQFIYADKILSNGYISRHFIPTTPSSLAPPYERKELTHSTLYDWQNNNEIKRTLYRTDKYGTIKPSSFENALSSHKTKPYTLFCGGSTTESSYVPEGNRIPDVYSSLSKVNSVNASRSGQDLNGCINTIDFLLSNTIIPPKNIVIATNSNSLMNFGYKLANRSSKNPYSRFKFLLRERIIPGIYHSYIKMNLLIKNFTLSEKFDVMPEYAGYYSKYEKGLLLGCCYGPSTINRKDPYEVDWQNNDNLKKYQKYVRNSISRLSLLLEKHSISKSDVFIFIENNSYRLESVAAKYDYRQKLHSFSGEVMKNNESAKIVEKFDNVYMKEFQSDKFNVLQPSKTYLNSKDFYDVVHLTKSGAYKLGKYYTEKLK